MAGVDSQYVPLGLLGNARRMPKHDAPAVADVLPSPAASALADVTGLVVVVVATGRVVVVVVLVVGVGSQAVSASAAATRISRPVRARWVVRIMALPIGPKAAMFSGSGLTGE